MPNKRRKSCSKKPYSKKPYKRSLSWEESNIKNNFLEVLVKRVLNDKAASNNNNKMVYGYYTKLLR